MNEMRAARVTKRIWYGCGGFANPRCFRKGTKRGWAYYILVAVKGDQPGGCCED